MAYSRTPPATAELLENIHLRFVSLKVNFTHNNMLRKVLSLALFFAVWQILCVINFKFFINFQFVPAPSEVVIATIEFMGDDPFIHFRSSLTRVLIGYSVAALLGVSTGIAIGTFQKIEDLLMPALEILRPIPAVAWIPLAILMFPSAEAGMVYITFIGGFFPILVSTIRGVESMLGDTVLLRVRQCLGASKWNIFRDIVIPGALPNIASGLAIGMGNAWFCLVTAEILAGRYGIGYITWESY
ncbi:MAG: ABC transporter permease, partial [Cyanobacteria bacterium J06649_11]